MLVFHSLRLSWFVCVMYVADRSKVVFVSIDRVSSVFQGDVWLGFPLQQYKLIKLRAPFFSYYLASPSEGCGW